jgi:hypothetical protein
MEDFNYDAACSDMEACNYGEPGDCMYPDECYDCDGNSTCYYSVDINPTGESHLVILMDSISTLDVGDEIGIFDLMGVVETHSSGTNPQHGEVLVGVGIWDGISNEQGAVLDVTAIMSLDLSDFNGPILNGAVDGNEIIVRVYDASEGMEYDMTTLTLDMGGEFGDIMTVVTEIDYEVVIPPSIGDACDIDGDGMVDDGFIIDCSLACVSDAFLGDAWCDEGFPNFNCAEFNCDEGACECEDLSNGLLSPMSFGLSQNYPKLIGDSKPLDKSSHSHAPSSQLNSAQLKFGKPSSHHASPKNASETQANEQSIINPSSTMPSPSISQASPMLGGITTS